MKYAAMVCTAMALAFVSGCASASSHRPTPSTHTGRVIAWANSPANVASPTSSTSPDEPRCDREDLSVQAGRHGIVGGGTFAYLYNVTNSGDRLCYISGYPQVISAEVTIRHTANILDVSPGPLEPGHSASFAITEDLANTGCGQSSTTPHPPTHQFTPKIAVGAPADPAILTPSLLTDSCESVAITPVGIEPSDPAPDALSPLTVTLAVPRAVARGLTLRFQVTITNPTATAITLDPCPNYETAVSGLPTLADRLNCTIDTIAPSQSLTYAMQYPIPTDSGVGETKFGWNLLNSTLTGAGTALTITR